MKRVFVICACIQIAAALAYAADTEATNKTTITSERLTFDYQRYTAEFEKNVVVIDPNMKMNSDRLNVVFDNESNIKQAIAICSVKLWQQEKTGYCDKAIYIAKTGEMMMIGNAQLKSGTDVVKGDKITFWINEDRMVCEPATLIITPKSKAGGSIFKEGQKDKKE